MNISEKNETYKAVLMGQGVSSVAMTTVTFQNGQKLTFNLIHFANEFGDPQCFFLRLNISFSLSNKYADLKKFC